MGTVILVPGVMGVTDLEASGMLMRYWSGWSCMLRHAGFDVFTAKQPLGGGLAKCEQSLRAQLDARTFKAPLHLVGHSRGGLAVRMLANHPGVRTVSCLGTPHRGQFLIDLLYDPNDADGARKSLLTGDGALTEHDLKTVMALVGDNPSLPNPVLRGPAVQGVADFRPDSDLYSETNVSALVAFNHTYGPQQGVAYCDVPGVLSHLLASPVLGLAPALISAADRDSKHAPQPVQTVRSRWQKTILDAYGAEVDVYKAVGWIRHDRFHDGAVCRDAARNPWRLTGFGPDFKAEHDPLELACPLDHCEQVGIVPSAGLPGLVYGLVHRLFAPAEANAGWYP
jgi:pimeloyl-ACP methyl ester carboxylesterase